MNTAKSKSGLRLVTPRFNPALAAAARDSVAADTDDYYRRMEKYARRIRRTADVHTIVGLLDKALSETRLLNYNAATLVAPAKLAIAEGRIETLKQELEQLRKLVHVDHLTGMLNRGGLVEAYTREAARTDRCASPLSAALLDLDDFKRLNDRHGHQAGDAALIHFAQIIKRTIRPTDIVVRFGGEEFLCLLPDSRPEQATQVLTRLRDELARHPLDYAGRKLPITFSAGIALRHAGETFDSVVARADRALYRAKENGKNRAMTAD